MIVGDRGPVVLVPPQVCRAIEATLVKALAEARRRGERVDDDVARVIGEVSAVAASARGEGLPLTATAAMPLTDADDALAHDDWLSTAEAAGVLGCGERNARHLAARHRLGHKRRGVWQFDPAAVDDWVATRGQAWNSE